MWTHTDKDQIDQIKTMWKEWGRYLFAAMIIGALVGMGWRMYKSYQESEAMKASVLYQQLLSADFTQKKVLWKSLQKHSGAPYAALAGLQMAKESVSNKDWSSAIDELKVAVNSGQPEFITELAKLRLASVYYQQKQYKQSLQQLSGLQESILKPLAQQMQAQIYTAQGDTKKARVTYLQAQSAMMAEGISDPILDREIAALPAGTAENVKVKVKTSNKKSINATKTKK